MRGSERTSAEAERRIVQNGQTGKKVEHVINGPETGAGVEEKMDWTRVDGRMDEGRQGGD